MLIKKIDSSREHRLVSRHYPRLCPCIHDNIVYADCDLVFFFHSIFFLISRAPLRYYHSLRPFIFSIMAIIIIMFHSNTLRTENFVTRFIAWWGFSRLFASHIPPEKTAQKKRRINSLGPSDANIARKIMCISKSNATAILVDISTSQSVSHIRWEGTFYSFFSFFLAFHNFHLKFFLFLVLFRWILSLAIKNS